MEAGGTRLIRYSNQDAEIDLWYLADIHYTNRGCMVPRLERDINAIKKDPYALWSLGGDYCDWITPKDPRFDPECVDEEMKVKDLAIYGALVTAKLVDLFLPIKDRCVGAGYGNHDLRYYTDHQAKFLHDQICDHLKVPNLRYSAVTVLYFERKRGLSGLMEYIKKPRPNQVNLPGQRRLVVYQHHGSGAAATAGGKINSLKRAVDSVDADLVMVGHLHEQLAKVFVRLTTNAYGTEINAKNCVAMMTGSYLRGNPSGCTQYSEVRGYPPTTIGATKARYRPGDGRLTVENAAEGVGVICG